MLSRFLPDGLTAEAFWQRVDDSFSAGRVKLVFVADTIPRELARIVEFLNEQMKADVRAVELSWFEADGVKAFTPRIIGETQRAQAAKASSRSLPPPVSQEEWIEKTQRRYGQDSVDGAHRFIELIADAGGHAEVAKLQGSLIGVFDLPFGSFFPISVGNGKVTLNFGYMTHRPAFKSEESRQRLYNQLVEMVGPLSTQNLTGFPGFPTAKLNEAQVRDGVLSLCRFIAAEAQKEAND
jgi:hypothetical protein